MAKTKVVQKNAYIWHSGLKGSTIFKRLFYNDVTIDVALVFNTKVTENRITSIFFFFFFFHVISLTCYNPLKQVIRWYSKLKKQLVLGSMIKTAKNKVLFKKVMLSFCNVF